MQGFRAAGPRRPAATGALETVRRGANDPEQDRQTPIRRSWKAKYAGAGDAHEPAPRFRGGRLLTSERGAFTTRYDTGTLHMQLARRVASEGSA